MIELENTEGFYFVGIGGIGMSALAFFFAGEGFTVAGYDRTQSRITDSLNEAGCSISFADDIESIPSLFKDPAGKERVKIVFTPAIPAESRILSFFRANDYWIFKRSEILGALSEKTDTIAIAGTHGKTTVSTMTAHILKQSSIDCSAFLGGVSKNYNSNLITGNSRFTVMEADEYDRSFLMLRPLIAVVTAVDPDHLEIYGDHKTMIAGYNEFIRKIRPKGILIYNYAIREHIECPGEVLGYTYGSDPSADYRYFNVGRRNDCYNFSIKTPHGVLGDIHFPFPGIINIENLTAAIAAALNCGVNEDEIRKAAVLFQGVRRRFDIRINRQGLTYIDDYAHHPEEIRAFIISVREYFGNRKITGIFQPHLFTRTKDHAEGFAKMLDTLDEVILLPIYPAREKPIPGVSSKMILDRMKLKAKSLLEMSDIPEKLDVKSLDVLLTIGAGNIDRLVEPIEQKLKKEAGE
ncbi:MAG: UDP-N-acetylmuramate--L-alanine ligase [Bacteroidales bacterium]|jgi:UDP-N-acetylmuramate--alanine ligase|nr:UDP-N-acetylmuramate--L-alanine ligase [Bacteroidales bacterium]